MTPAYTVAVRALCAFTARTGDLDLRFTPAPTALEGMEGHALVAARRGAGWQAERPVSATVGDVRVRGRIDGWDAARLRVEEIKTHKGRLEDQPAHHRALHRAQLHVYGALLCMELGLDELELALVYVDVGTQQETVLLERASAAALQVPRTNLTRVMRPIAPARPTGTTAHGTRESDTDSPQRHCRRGCSRACRSSGSDGPTAARRA